MTKISPQACPHVNENASPSGHVSEHCAECNSSSSLRWCATCGHVGCCESQQGHGALHARESGHPVIRSLPLSANSFTWRSACNAYVG